MPKKSVPLDEALTTAFMENEGPSSEHNEQKEENARGGCLSFFNLFARKKLKSASPSEAQISDDKYRIRTS